MYLSISHKQIMAFSSLLITMSFLLGAVLAVHAYGSEQWQIGLSFNCNAPVSFCAGLLSGVGVPLVVVGRQEIASSTSTTLREAWGQLTVPLTSPSITRAG